MALYPPILNTYQPAFVENSPCRIYFSLSKFNSLEDIQNVQVAVRNQRSNANVLNKQYVSEIKLCELKTDTSKTSDNKYYIELNAGDVSFSINQYYKVQLRFSSAAAASIPLDTKGLDTWLVQNAANFSEWSTITLIRQISTPSIDLSDIFNEDSYSSSFLSFDTKLKFADVAQTEYLAKYRIKLYNSKTSILLFDSGDLYPYSNNNYNNIQYDIPYKLQSDVSYQLAIEILTNDKYSQTFTFDFTVNYGELTPPALGYIYAEPDEEDGFITVEYGFNELSGTFMASKSTNESDFTLWDDIQLFGFEVTSELDKQTLYIDCDYLSYAATILYCDDKEKVKIEQPNDYYTLFLDKAASYVFTYVDYNVQYGMLYSYGLQRVGDQVSKRSELVELNEPVIAVFDYVFLAADNKQLKLKFDGKVTSYRHAITQSKIDTIGSRFPYITRNADTNYRQLSLTGLISFMQDENKTFAADDEVYGGGDVVQQAYRKFDEQNRITYYTDIKRERFFRELVTKYLYTNQLFLLKSPTQGNIIIKLMDISLSPRSELNNLIYSFTATAYEMDEYNTKNIYKYNIFVPRPLTFAQLNAARAQDSVQKATKPASPQISSIRTKEGVMIHNESL